MVIANCVRLLDAGRAAGAQAVLVHVGRSADGRDALQLPVDETWRPSTPPQQDWSDLLPELNQQPGDVVILKREWGAFYGTDLDLQLRRRGMKGDVEVVQLLEKAGALTTEASEQALRFAQTAKVNTLEAYQAFLREFDNGPVPSVGSVYWAAREKIEALIVADIKAHGVGKRPLIPALPDSTSVVGSMTFFSLEFAPDNGGVIQTTSLGMFALFSLYPSDGPIQVSDNGTGLNARIPKGEGSVHRFVGKVNAMYQGCEIVGDTKEPLSFLLTANGYVYLDGRGSVTFSEGKKLSFPPAAATTF